MSCMRLRRMPLPLEQPPDVLGQPGQLVDPGVQYYLRHVMPHGVPVPRELFVSKTSPQSN